MCILISNSLYEKNLMKTFNFNMYSTYVKDILYVFNFPMQNFKTYRE